MFNVEISKHVSVLKMLIIKESSKERTASFFRVYVTGKNIGVFIQHSNYFRLSQNNRTSYELRFDKTLQRTVTKNNQTFINVMCGLRWPPMNKTIVISEQAAVKLLEILYLLFQYIKCIQHTINSLCTNRTHKYTDRMNINCLQVHINQNIYLETTSSLP